QAAWKSSGTKVFQIAARPRKKEKGSNRRLERGSGLVRCVVKHAFAGPTSGVTLFSRYQQRQRQHGENGHQAIHRGQRGRAELSAETTGKIRACKREWAARMARAAGQVAWLFGEPDRGVESHRDAGTRQRVRAEAWSGACSFR